MTTTEQAQDQDQPIEDGAQLLALVRGAVTRYVVLPDADAEVAVTLWIAATHAVPAWTHAARLVIRAPEKRCGKSRLLDLVEAMSHKPLMTANASSPAIYRSIGQFPNDPPTILLDEGDTVFGPKAGSDHEDLRGLLNAGHQRGRPAIRYDAATRRVERIDTFAMAALAGIGAMPDTIEDRAVVIRMRRRAPGETVAPFRARRDGPALDQLRARLYQWVRAQLVPLELATPRMPIEDRAADTWEPLIAIADLAGGGWPALARQAAVVLTDAGEVNAQQTTRTRLLGDCRTAFRNAQALPSVELLRRLKDDPEAPWATYGHVGLTPVRLAELLRDFDVQPDTIRFPKPGYEAVDGQRKGYYRNAFTDAWQRYCPTGDTGKSYQSYQPYPRDQGSNVSPSEERITAADTIDFEPYQSRTTRTRAVPAVPEPYQPIPQADKGERRGGTAGTGGTGTPGVDPGDDGGGR
ncbi:DUF3631 domain-containing protein [Microlunatus sp. Y2014]|uniref:DUF3631 domain-containing protein n=1 Tax=Microlunatus sp. Y2014 TaxID=3418488 RepID=UPI003DA749CB